MCGIFGLVATPSSRLERSSIPDVLRKLYRLSESRGKDAAGLLTMTRERIEIVKAATRGSLFCAQPETIAAIDKAIAASDGSSAEALVVIGHTRMVTNGGAGTHNNNQPVIKDALACIHNGIITNDQHVWKTHPGYRRDYEVDTEALLALVHGALDAGQPLVAALTEAFREIRGANSVALASTYDDALLLATSNGSLFFAGGDAGQALVFASERYILERTLRHAALRRLFACSAIHQLHPGAGALVCLNSPEPITFDLQEPGSVAVAPKATTTRSIADVSLNKTTPAVQPASLAYAEFEKLLVIDFDAIRALQRCVACLLPETFPFIEFDARGVCHYCRSHVPMRRKGVEALRRELEPICRATGRPDCLVPLSGGRDSCYGIHYIKNDLGLNPVAYTYDWGMVTDLARRNISRMCGALGIEHILISADIQQKREFIRLNVEAWLKKPHLGTIPLFMAGDKHFFFYANMLKRQMKLQTVLFSMNPLERTDFKVGFCGINEKHSKEKHYNLSAFNKVRIGMFYAKGFLSNPGYLNISLLDSAFAYFSYYLIRKNYLTLYDYIEWDEKTIVDTLIQSYDWETAQDTRSTWRIGDGTAAFYNYIYLRVAGFTENDTFRSNQIREGLITRDQALQTLEEENLPRAASIRWYCDTIGIDCQRALQQINRIPTPFGRVSKSILRQGR
jgi:hypothetical protein